ncbi:MAG TPA: lysophospholipid acyltransferase family protein [Longimicrobiaceae bacterium]|nr:lysophospholipid acyltransferase family protein [Longimicrobiaceae bacterium]
MFYLRVLAAVAVFGALSVAGVLGVLFSRDRERMAVTYTGWVGRWVPPLLRLRVRVTGRERLTAHRPCVFIGNHQSALDVPVLANCFTPGSVAIGKKEIAAVPVFGWLFDATGQIRIDRGDREQAVGRLKEAEEAIRVRRVGVWILPEGTRGREPGVMLPFKKGAFLMAIHTGAPLVPIVTSPLRPRSDLRARRLQPNDVEVRVLEPIPTDGLTDADLPWLMAQARHRMYAALADMSRERGVEPPPEALEAPAAAQRPPGASSSGFGGGTQASSTTTGGGRSPNPSEGGGSSSSSAPSSGGGGGS